VDWSCLLVECRDCSRSVANLDLARAKIFSLTTTPLLVSLCFGRLLTAILRVRKTTQREQENASPWAREQERVMTQSRSTTPYKMAASFLPPLHSNFSGLSTSFIGTVGRSTSTVNVSTIHADILPFTSSHAPGVSYAPSSRHSLDDDFGLRDVRSPTPGSIQGLLNGRRDSVSGVSSPASTYTQTPRQDDAHEIITFEDMPRPSFGSYASASTYMTGGFVGGTAMRQAIVNEVWAGSQPPGSGHGPKVELSQKEARGALVRIGGHLSGCLLGYVSWLYCISQTKTLISLVLRPLSPPSSLSASRTPIRHHPSLPRFSSP
jgi:hypothetical protein